MRSKNKYDVFTWVMQVTASAKTDEQKESASNLIWNMIRQFQFDFNDPMRQQLEMMSMCL